MLGKDDERQSVETEEKLWEKWGVLWRFIKGRLWDTRNGTETAPQPDPGATSEQETAVAPAQETTTALEPEREPVDQMKDRVAAFTTQLITALTEQLGEHLGETDLFAKLQRAIDNYKNRQPTQPVFESKKKEQFVNDRFFNFTGETANKLKINCRCDFDIGSITISMGDERATVTIDALNSRKLEQTKISVQQLFGDTKREEVQYDFFPHNKSKIGVLRSSNSLITEVNYAVADAGHIGFENEQIVTVRTTNGLRYDIEYPTLRVINGYGGGGVRPDIELVSEGTQIHVSFPRQAGKPEVNLPALVSIDSIFQYITSLASKKADAQQLAGAE